MKSRKFDYYPILFVAVLCLFYPELVTAKSAPLVSDHWEQHYPWAYYLSVFIKQWKIPLWTPLIHSGFPIAAESQIGIFYLPNLLLSLLLPIHFSYSYTVLLHFAMSGLFSYYYLRTMNLSAPAAFCGASIFVFGTGYGGAYYNITSLKTLCWLPLMFLCYEQLFGTRKIKWALLLSLAVGMCLVAGYMQVAALTLFIFLLYAVFRFFQFFRTPTQNSHLPSFVFLLGAGGLLGILIALPQILLTFQLAVQSNRTGLEEGYAYVGSLSPLALGTIIFPYLQGLFRGNCLYQGIFTFFLFFIAMTAPKQGDRKKFFSLWLFMLAAALLFALGRWSPVYIAFIKLTGFYSFRTPAKFLIFFNLAFAYMGALGIDLLKDAYKQNNLENFKPLVRRLTLMMGGILFIYVSAYFMLIYFRPQFEDLGQWALHKFIYGQAGHAHSLEIYYEKLNSILDFSVNLLNPRKPWFLWSTALILLSLFLLKKLILDSKKFPRILAILLALLLFDLYLFSFVDIRTDFASYKSTEKENETVQLLKQLNSAGKLKRIFIYKKPDENLYLTPSVNMLYGIEDIGAYSPLVTQRYYETIGTLGNVNDSNTSMEADPEYVYQRIALLQALGVSHIVSTQPLSHVKLIFIFHDTASGLWLYQIEGNSTKSFFVQAYDVFDHWPELKTVLLSPRFDPHKKLLIEKSAVSEEQLNAVPETAGQTEAKLIDSASGPNEFQFSADQPGYFVVMQTYFPGWRAYLNNAEVPIIKAYGLFQAVRISEPGDFILRFKYDWKKAWRSA